MYLGSNLIQLECVTPLPTSNETSSCTRLDVKDGSEPEAEKLRI